MITEDYVSFETAKLLKEKGFREWCSYCYGLDVRYKGESIDQDEEFELKEQGKDGELEYVEGGRLYHFGCDNRKEGSPYAAPSLYVVMKWLRTIHNIDIETLAEVGILGKKVYVPMISTYKNRKDDPEKLTQLKFGIYDKDDKGGISALKYYKTYEESCEAAIKYCLENLI